MEIAELIASMGFPIAACLAMAWYVKYMTDCYNKQLEEIRLRHEEETKKLAEAINNNTMALQMLSERLSHE